MITICLFCLFSKRVRRKKGKASFVIDKLQKTSMTKLETKVYFDDTELESPDGTTIATSD